ncbi:MAG: DUF192 domain-containing protein [Proteobacteria bacterium]|jgi:uncharacterized membrane protein (UPF0127 family)|nr:DUF192 domain-containing protein [Pseudomonadota bacterium]MBT5794735.1 DUF192 domain-containing protein [Deltaproteobacteria bacterium]
MILRNFIFYTITISFCSIVFFGSGSAFAKQLKYAHALVKTSAGIEIHVEVADTSQKRSLGLGKRSGLKKDWGMLFVFEKRKTHSFWMKDMQFALDIIWLDNYRIVHILRNVQPAIQGEKPSILAPPAPANFVLEIEAGRASELRLKQGDLLKYNFEQ